MIAAARESVSISTFCLHGNLMSDESAEAMSNALSNFARLSSYYISGYAITGKGLQTLTHATKTNPFIKRAYILGCGINESDITDCVGRLQVRGSDLSLHLASGKISELACDKLMSEYKAKFKTLLTTRNWLYFCNVFRNGELLNLK